MYPYTVMPLGTLLVSLESYGFGINVLAMRDICTAERPCMLF